MRARLALRYAGIRCALREVVLRDKPAAMLEASPKGTVPILVLGDAGSEPEVIDESLDIMLWALAQNDPAGWLDVDPATASELIDANDDGFKIWLDRYKYPQRYEDIAPGEPRDHCERFLRELDQRLASADGVAGQSLALPDYALLPFVRQCAFVETGWFRSLSLEALNRWLDGFLEGELFAAVMQKYPQWHPADPVTVF